MNATAMALDRIALHDDRVGAFVDVLAERALRDADQAEADVASGVGGGALHGVPIGVKELFDVEGADGSYGSLVLAGRRAQTDAALVASLRRAGAIVVGTTRSHEFGWGITTQHELRGSTANPWDLRRVPGGSSGGSAAAVAAGLVPLAVGSDTGGSVRLPAAFCGVFGLKTTFGRISRAGGVALAPSFDSPGFLARSVGLLAAAFSACCAADENDPPTMLSPLAGPVEFDTGRNSRLRFAVPAALAPGPIEDARDDAVQAVVAALRRFGMQQTDVSLPDGRELFDVFVPLQMAEALDVHANVLGLYPAAADSYGSDVRGRLEQARSVTIAEYLHARRSQQSAQASFARAFQFADLMVSPVGGTAPSLATSPDSVWLMGSETPTRTAMMPFTVPQNICGLPSITIPVGFDQVGMPIGIQITGAPWSEPVLLSAAFALERDGIARVATPAAFL